MHALFKNVLHNLYTTHPALDNNQTLQHTFIFPPYTQHSIPLNTYHATTIRTVYPALRHTPNDLPHKQAHTHICTHARRTRAPRRARTTHTYHWPMCTM
jgi:hypothetical protein